MQMPEYQNASWLREKYYDEGMSLVAIGRACGRSPETIRRWMKKNKIRLRSRHKAIVLWRWRQRHAKNEEQMRSLLLQIDESAGLLKMLEQELDDEKEFKDNPELLKRLRERRQREIEKLLDKERRRAQRLAMARKLDPPGSYNLPYTAEDQMDDILERFERPSRKK